jgi:hypothetical protein
MLRVRHISRIAAEQDLLEPVPVLSYPVKLTASLYRNAAHTNINVWGTVALIGAYVYIIAGSYWLILLLPAVLLSKLLPHGLKLAWGTGARFIHSLKDGILAASSAFSKALTVPQKQIPTHNPLRRRSTASMYSMQLQEEQRSSGNRNEPDNQLRMAQGNRR